MLHMHHAVIVIELFQLGFVNIVHEVERIHRLEIFELHSLVALSHVGFCGVEHHTLHEFLRPNHLHFHQKLATASVAASHVNNAVFSHRIVGHKLGWEVFHFLNQFIVGKRQHSIEQADYKVFMFAEYALKRQVGFRVEVSHSYV